MVGFALGNPIVVTVGGLVAAAGWTLAAIVAQALGRKPSTSLLRLGPQGGQSWRRLRQRQACGAEEAAMELETARKVVIVPGYGMAVAQAQHALTSRQDAEQRGAKVSTPFIPRPGSFPAT
jgi:NAD(P) transhydrogenase subunit beta